MYFFSRIAAVLLHFDHKFLKFYDAFANGSSFNLVILHVVLNITDRNSPILYSFKFFSFGNDWCLFLQNINKIVQREFSILFGNILGKPPLT